MLHALNDECLANGLPPIPDLPPRPPPCTDAPSAPKWRICHDFAEINEFLNVPPFPQGDIRDKQRRLSGHWWLCKFDLASGFSALEADKDAQPYLVFFVPGMGFYAYCRMPFGVRDAPTAFNEAVGKKVGDMVVSEAIELVVDDMGCGIPEDFEAGLQKLEGVLLRLRAGGLSVSPKKTELFVAETVFGGATCGRNGVSPDLAKLSAIVEWPQPENAQDLESFLGLCAWFRDLIRDYARIEGPLRDLLLGVVPHGASKCEYRRVSRAHKLAGVWGAKHTECFVLLKRLLTSEPVLRAPRYDTLDQHPFYLTTDGCAEGFGAVLSQDMETTLDDGRVVVRRHAVGFASKRTSDTEKRYGPHVLKFAAAKFGAEKFSDTIWGQPVVLETDCSALRDVLSDPKLGMAHARWRDGLLGYNIIAVRHIEGKRNRVADALSRRGEGREREAGDGSEWTVDSGWESRAGLVNDVYAITAEDEDAVLTRLRLRFQADLLFRRVIDAMIIERGTDEKATRRARHATSEYFVEGGKLWRLGRGGRGRAVTRRECVTAEEARALAAEHHKAGGHFGRELVKLALMEKVVCPGLDGIIIEVIRQCGQCRAFGPTHIHARLEPITRRRPFELLVMDYLKLPLGKGGFHTALLVLDTCSQNTWGFKFRKHGSAKTTIDSLRTIFHLFMPADVAMSDQGPHFKNGEVKEFLDSQGVKHVLVAVYSPWINGLVEGMNKILLRVLARLCAPDASEDEWNAATWDALPKNWPDHFDDAIRVLNWRILPTIKFSPREILLGLDGSRRVPFVEAQETVRPADIDLHMAQVEQVRLDGYAARVEYALGRKAAFDRRLLADGTGEVTFVVGDLVQRRNQDADNKLSAQSKMVYEWSGPYRVIERQLHSYRLANWQGTEVSGWVNTRHLRPYGLDEREREEREVGEWMAGLQEFAGAEAADWLGEV
uniref:Retrotransposon-like family member n=1 Tax=Mycena chlorophos TaxID=658473 RepID=A0ABQ0L7P7_MYCCL|nr:retrotransposon-like family member [Mycena chlorophos]